MSSVSASPGDSGLASYYQNKLKEHSNETDSLIKKKNQAHENELDRLQASKRDSLLQKEKESNKTLENMRSNSTENALNEKEKYKSNLKEIKDQIYNQRGSFSNQEDSSQIQSIQQYQNQLKTQNEQELSRAHKNQEEEIKNLKEQQQETLKKQELDSKETIQNIKKQSSERLHDEKQNLRNLVHELKKDKESALKSDEKDIQLRNYENQLRTQAEQENLQSKLLKKNQDDKMSTLIAHNQRQNQENQNSFNETIQNIQDQAQETNSRYLKQYQKEADDLNNQLKNLAEPPKEYSVPLNVYERQLENIFRAQEEMLSNSKNNLEDQNQKHEDVIRKTELKGIKNNQLLNESNTQSRKELNDQLNDVTQGSSNLSNSLNTAHARLNQENENQKKIEIQRLSESYDGHLGKLEEKIRNQETYYQNLNRDSLKEKDQYLHHFISKKDQENNQNIKNLSESYENQIHELNQIRDHEKRQSIENLEKANQRAAENTEETLNKQAAGYEELIHHTNKNTNNKIENLQTSLGEHETSGKTSLISPAAESNLRNSIIQQYEKTSKIDLENRKQEIDHIQQKFKDQYYTAQADFQDKTTKMHQNIAYEKTLDRAQFFDAIQETEDQSKFALRVEAQAREQEKEKLFKHFTHELEKQRKNSETYFERERNNSQIKLTEARQELAHEMKTFKRDSLLKQNEITQKYEKKLNDQKTEYENRLEQLKDQMQERERHNTQSLQEELDKTRRSYELISKKKS